MLIDARELTDGTVLRAPVCVVGAGAAGITVARALSAAGIEVVLLESGGLDPDPATQALYEGELVGEPFHGAGNDIGLDEVRLRYFGGTTNHWTGFCRPLEPVDFEARPGLDLSGWPLDRADLDPWYDRAIEVVRLASPRFDLGWWQTEHGLGPALLQTDLVDTTLFQVHLGFSWGRAYRAELEADPRVQVVLWANATRLAMRPDSDELEAVEARTLSGVGLRVEADRFVVALGGIETPRLLLASNDVRTAGVGNGRDLVGRHFCEHLRAQVGHLLFTRTPDDLSLYLGSDIPAPYPDAPDNAISAQGALTLSRRALLDGGLLGCELQFGFLRPFPDPDASPRLFRDGLTLDHVGPLLGGVEGTPVGATAYAQVLAEQEVRPESRVLLGSERDALGMPTVAVDWRHSALDRSSIVAALGVFGRELGRTGVGRLLSLPGGMGYMTDPEPEDFPFVEASAAGVDPEGFEIGVGFHHLCTCRMDDDPARGVVDRDCRVHEVANLYLGGDAVFATPGTATPTFTITALALRLADHLRSLIL